MFEEKGPDLFFAGSVDVALVLPCNHADGSSTLQPCLTAKYGATAAGFFVPDTKRHEIPAVHCPMAPAQMS